MITLKQLTDLLHLKHDAAASFKTRALAHPVRDWKITLICTALLIALVGVWVFVDLSFAPAAIPDDTAGAPKTVPLDHEALGTVIMVFDERAVLHAKSIESSSGIVDPGQ
jgi:hypothetical protein